MASLRAPSMLWGLHRAGARTVHVYPAWQEHVHQLDGLDCPCRPRLSVLCQACAGDGCAVCEEDGWIEPQGAPAPDEALVVVHEVVMQGALSYTRATYPQAVDNM